MTAHPTQDCLDGKALRLLREASPTYADVDVSAGAGVEFVTVEVWDGGQQPKVRARAPTIAEAADACRTALEKSG